MLPDLDPLIHAQARLQVMTVLAHSGRPGEVAFPQLQELLGLTAGNLSTHLRRLEDARYIAVTKAYRDRTPVTWVTLTDLGRDRLDRYRTALRTYLDGSTALDLLPSETDV